MEQLDKLGSKFKESFYFKIFRAACVIILMWLMGTAIITIMEYNSHYDKVEATAVELFKKECIEKEGSVRHDRAIFTLDVYCAEASGNETVFSLNEQAPDIREMWIERAHLSFITDL